MQEVVLIGLGLVAGLAIGRWWALLGAVAVGVWIFLVSEVDEVPAWFLALGYCMLRGAGVAAGVLVRRSLR